MAQPLLLADLSVGYPGKLNVLEGLRLSIGAGEILGLVGESGSGKSSLALALLGLLDVRGAKVRGRIEFGGRNLLHLGEREMRRVRGKQIGLVLQSASSSLNPRLSVGDQLKEAWRAHEGGRWSEAKEHLAGLLKKMGLPHDEAFLRRYPGQISVGQAQRILIAMAVIHNPALVIADEPTSALDVITQAQVNRLLRDLATDSGISVLYISHDLPSVASVCDRISILHGGRIVESGSCSDIFSLPAHPYTRALIAALPLPPMQARSLTA
jgi:ABC-type glutathione transport system ATPase component